MVVGVSGLEVRHGLSVLCRFGMGERPYSVDDGVGMFFKNSLPGDESKDIAWQTSTLMLW